MKNNMDYFKTMNEKDLDLTKTAVDWTDKAFRGNGDCLGCGNWLHLGWRQPGWWTDED